MKKSKLFIKKLKKYVKKIKKFVQLRKRIFISMGALVLVVGVVLFVLWEVKLLPNSDIYETSDNALGLFESRNPTFQVTFGKKDDEDTQWVRFESETSNKNKFDPGYEAEEKTLLNKVADFFTKDKTLGIEMSLTEVKLSETGNETIEEIRGKEDSVQDILGTDDIETSTELLEVGRNLGELDSDQNITQETILNKEVWKGIDLEYQILEGVGLKEEIIIRDLESYMAGCEDSETGCEYPLNEFVFDLQLDEGVELHQSIVSVRDNPVGTYYFTDNKGNYLAHFLPSYAFDGNGSITNHIDFYIKEVGEDRKYEIHLILDMEWLLDGDRVYPIHIDPSIIHDDEADFDAGQALNRVESITGPKVQLLLLEQEMETDENTVGLWHLNEDSGSTVYDSSGNGNNGVATGTTVVTGMFDDARDFNGSSDYITISDQDSFSFGNGSSDSAFSVEAWVKFNDATSSTIISKYTTSPSNAREWILYSVGTDLLKFQLFDNSNGAYISRNTAAITKYEGEWIYVVATYDGSGSSSGITIYINGVQADETTADSGTYVAMENTSRDVIMGCFTTTYYFDGTIDEVRVSDSVRTVEEVEENYRKRNDEASSYGVYISDVLDLTENVSSIDYIQWIESSVSTGDGETPYSSTSLVGKWDFNETSGTTADNEGSCGATCDGTLISMTTTGQDDAIGSGWTYDNRKWGEGAVILDGSDDYIDMGNYVIGTGDKTVSFWMNMISEGTGYSQIMTNTIGLSSSDAGFDIYQYEANDNLGFIIGNSTGSDQYLYCAGSALNIREWYYITMVQDSDELYAYVNGELYCSDTSASGTEATDAYPLRIGTRNISLDYFFNGIIDAVQIYSRAFSESEILANYNKTNIEFMTRTSADGVAWEEWQSTSKEGDSYTLSLLHFDGEDESTTITDESSKVWTTTGSAQLDISEKVFGKASLLLDGTSDYISTPDSGEWDLGTDDFTIDLWVRWDTLTNATFWSQVEDSGNFSWFGLVDPGSSWCLDFYVERSGSGVLDVYKCGLSLSEDTWYHVAVTKSSGIYYLFLDGELLGSWANASNITSLNGGIYVGGDTLGGYDLNGWIDEFRFSNDIARWTSSFTPETTPYSSPETLLVSMDEDQISVDNYSIDSYTKDLLHFNGDDESTTFIDEIGKTWTAVNDAQLDTAQKEFGTASLLLDGDDYIYASDSDDWRLDDGSNNNEWTVDFWVRFASVPGTVGLWQQYEDVDNRIGFNWLNSSSAFQFYVRSGGSTIIDVRFSYTPSVDTWYHIVLVKQGSTGYKCFVNGTQIDSTQTDASVLPDLNGSFCIGRYVGSSTYYLDGWVDEFRVSKGTARWINDFASPPTCEYDANGIIGTSTDEVTLVEGTGSEKIEIGGGQVDATTVALWHLDETNGDNAGDDVFDETSNSNDGEFYGTDITTSVVEGVFGKAREFNGTDDYIDLSTYASSFDIEPITISFWVKSTSDDSEPVFEIRDSGGSDYSVITIGGNATGYCDNELITIGTKRGGSTSNRVCYETLDRNELFDGDWHHVVIISDSSRYYVYLDGDPKELTIGFGSYDGEWGGISAVSAYIGHFIDGGSYLDGTIDEFEITNTVKTQKEILEEYNLGRNQRVSTSFPSANVSYSTKVPFWIAADTPGSYIEAIIGESDYVNGLSDANTVGLWHLDEIYKADYSSNDNDAIVDYYGITYGLLESNLTFHLNQWNGSSNTGEIDITCPGGDSECEITTLEGVTVSTTSINSGIAVYDSESGDGFIMYSPVTFSSRGISAYSNNSNNYIAVRYNSGSWQYNNNSSWVTFTPIDGDTLVAKVTFFSDLEHIEQPEIVDGKIGMCADFDGEEDYIEILDSDSLNVTTAVTVEAWVKPMDLTTGGIAGKWESANFPYLLWFYDINQKFSFVVNNGQYVYSTTTPIIGEWYHVVGTYDGVHIKIYINGKLENQADLAGGINTDSVPFRIGRYSNDGSTFYYFNGLIDEVRVSSVARIADEIRQTYERGLRTHTITIDFAASLDSGGTGGLITGSGDTSFTVDATEYELSQQGSGLYVGDYVIVKENVSGTEYIAQGEVDSIVESTGEVSVSSWDVDSTFPSGGFTSNATVFKWQLEYFDITEPLDTQMDAITSIALRVTNGEKGRTIWLDDFEYATYLTDDDATANVTSTVQRYFQYKAILTTRDGVITPYISEVTVGYSADAGPTTEDLMRHGKWFNTGGEEQSFWWAD